MTSCNNCDELSEPGSIFCALHSAVAKPRKHAGSRTFLFSMAIGLIVGAMVLFGYATTHASSALWVTSLHSR
jgi:hypothetical protein